MQYIWSQNFKKQENFVHPSKISVDVNQKDQWCFKYSIHAEQFAGLCQFDILWKLQIVWYPEIMQCFSKFLNQNNSQMFAHLSAEHPPKLVDPRIKIQVQI